jgi:hypothetical protein
VKSIDTHMIHCRSPILFFFFLLSRYCSLLHAYMRFILQTERLESFRIIERRVSIFSTENNHGLYTREILQCEGFLIDLIMTFSGFAVIFAPNN